MSQLETDLIRFAQPVNIKMLNYLDKQHISIQESTDNHIQQMKKTEP